VATAHERATGKSVAAWLPAEKGQWVGRGIYSSKREAETPSEAWSEVEAPAAGCQERAAAVAPAVDAAGDTSGSEEESESGQVMLHIGKCSA